MGFNRRFAPLAVRLKEFLEERGEPLAAHYRVNAGYLPSSHWLHDPQQGGGRIIGEGCHFVDFLAFLVGEAPVEVTARALPDAGRYHEDNAVLTFSFADGSIGVVSYLANGDKSAPQGARGSVLRRPGGDFGRFSHFGAGHWRKEAGVPLTFTAR